jgi:hypothetical protein
MNGKKNYRKQADDIRSSLDDILNDSDGIDSPIDATELPSIRRPDPFDYGKKKSDATFQAKKTINTLLKFYLSEEIINNDEYVKAKMKIEEMTLSSLIFQMETGERAITTLLQQIDDGDVSPRMFEVLGTLQKSMLDIIKSQTMYMMATEECVKKLARDYDVYSERKNLKGGEEVKKIEGPTNVNRGTKNLMMQIQNEITPATEEKIIMPEIIEEVIDEDDFPVDTEEFDDYDE